VDDRLVIADLQERAETAEAVAQLLQPGEDNSRRPTAIVAANDHLAWQVIQELQERGISVGSDPNGHSIAVTGFDDLPFAGYVQPSLTTVRQPIAAISDILLDLLVMLIKNEMQSKRKVSLSAKAIRLAQDKQSGGHKQVDKPGAEKSEQPVKWIGAMQALVVPELVIRDSA
jgi:LacI family transcriptional regulator